MKVKYLTLSQAIAIGNEYQYLVGRPFEKDNPLSALIEQIVVAPYSKIMQWEFLRRLAKGSPWAEAIEICVNRRYDVLILPADYSRNNKTFGVKELRRYLEEFNFSLPHDSLKQL